MKNKIANPAPLGSLGFGMTTILYSMVNAGFFEVNAMLLSMAIFLGGTAQILAGVLEYKKGNTFGFISYIMFGFYWYTIVSITLLPALDLASPASSIFMGYFFFLWTIFTIMLLLKTLKMDKFTITIFSVVVLLFLSITIYNFTELKVIGYISGYLGILCGSLAMLSAYKNMD